MNYSQELKFNALLAWISQLQNIPNITIKQLWNGQILLNISKKIQNFKFTTFQYNQETSSCAVLLAYLKKYFKQLEKFYRNTLQKEFNTDHCDILRVAQHKDEKQIFNLFLLVFGACVQAENKIDFIQAITHLEDIHKEVLMYLIQIYGFCERHSEENLNENKRQQQSQSMITPQQTQLNHLLSKLQNLQSELQKKQFLIQRLQNQKRKILGKCQQLEIQNQRLREQLSEKISVIQDNQKYQAETSIYEEVNLSIAEQLKQKLYSEEKRHYQEKIQLQETIEFLKESLQKAKKELQYNGSKQETVVQNKKSIQHTACITLQKHRQILLNNSQKLKDLTKSEWESKLQCVTLKNEIDKLNKEILKLKQENNKKVDYLIDKKDAENIKLDILLKLRNQLKKEVQKIKSDHQ